ncbi:MAG: molybdopterin molybdotransferase MoeA [Bacteroidetes bacterium]|nr:MAG: molybdopterin molybdotransferase MoeA [Bacteroidota bacterium]
MISVTEARGKVINNTSSLTPVLSTLSEAAGKTLAEDVYSNVDIPAFDQSSMDGYAFSFSDWKSNQILPIKGELAAGSNDVAGLSPGHAVRIFTGAAVPAGADTVVMQEKTKIENDRLAIADENIVPGLNVRAKGSEIRSGELAIAKDSSLTPAAIGFLASIGRTEVLIYPYPSISIIVTGNELQVPGSQLQPGQVYESNSFSLMAALRQLHFDDVKVYKAEDRLETVTQILKKALQQSDIVFLTGGVSVGDYDFVATAAAQNGIEKIFHKIKQRPGKPLYFGKLDNKLIFGLPGNPASVLTCFYEYAEPALKKMVKQKTGIQVVQAQLAGPLKKAAGLTHFLKGYFDGKIVTALHGQESFRLSSFAKANCLIKIGEEVTVCDKGEPVEVHLLPF